MDITEAPQAPQATEAALTPETAAPTPAPEHKPVSPQFEVLAKREREIVRKMQEAKRLEEQLKGKEDKYKSWEEKKARARENPLEALQELGLSYEELTQYILNDQKPTPDMEVKSVRDEIRKMREEHEAQQKAARERQQQEIEQSQKQAVDNFKADLSDFLTTNAETYELVSLLGDQGVDLIFDTIQEDWAKKVEKYEAGGRVGRPPKIMSTEEAAGLVESFYEQEMDSYYSKSKKLQGKYQKPKLEEALEANSEQPAPAAGLPKTLSNGLISPSAPTMVSAANDQDRMLRALKALGE